MSPRWGGARALPQQSNAPALAPRCALSAAEGACREGSYRYCAVPPAAARAGNCLAPARLPQRRRRPGLTGRSANPTELSHPAGGTGATWLECVACCRLSPPSPWNRHRAARPAAHTLDTPGPAPGPPGAWALPASARARVWSGANRISGTRSGRRGRGSCRWIDTSIPALSRTLQRLSSPTARRRVTVARYLLTRSNGARGAEVRSRGRPDPSPLTPPRAAAPLRPR
jgi:hypothetical protein